MLELEKYANNLFLIFTSQGIVVTESDLNFLLPLQTVASLNLTILGVHVDKNQLMLRAECHLSEAALSQKGIKICPVKPLLLQVTHKAQLTLMRAYHWYNWDTHSQFCGKCGAKLQSQAETTEKKCTHCQQSYFPRFSPAVMVLIQKEDKILLARSPHFQPGIYSAIAGFIDIGESAEAAAHREVKEEVGLEITDLKYFATQLWPFPDCLMIAFTAKYVSGEIKCDFNEIEDAKWFSINQLPDLPKSVSIARQLIDSACV